MNAEKQCSKIIFNHQGKAHLTVPSMQVQADSPLQVQV